MSPTATIFRPENQLTHPGASEVVVVDALPKTATGKIRKNVVRDAHARLYQTT